jgi:hypothetical protein
VRGGRWKGAEEDVASRGTVRMRQRVPERLRRDFS